MKNLFYAFILVLSIVSCKKEIINPPTPTNPGYPQIAKKMVVSSSNPNDTSKVTYEYDAIGRIVRDVSYTTSGQVISNTYAYFPDSITVKIEFQNNPTGNSYFGTYFISPQGKAIKYIYRDNNSSQTTTYLWDGDVIDSVKLDYYNSQGSLIASSKGPFIQNKPTSVSFTGDTIPSYFSKAPYISPLDSDFLQIFGETFTQYNQFLPSQISYSNQDWSSNSTYSYTWSGNKITQIYISGSYVMNGVANQGWSKVFLIYN